MAEILATSTLDFLPNFDTDLLLLLIKNISSAHWLISPILGDVTVSQWKCKKLIYYCGGHGKTCIKDTFRWEVRVQNGYSLRFSLQKDSNMNGIASYEALGKLPKFLKAHL